MIDDELLRTTLLKPLNQLESQAFGMTEATTATEGVGPGFSLAALEKGVELLREAQRIDEELKKAFLALTDAQREQAIELADREWSARVAADPMRRLSRNTGDLLRQWHEEDLKEREEQRKKIVLNLMLKLLRVNSFPVTTGDV